MLRLTTLFVLVAVGSATLRLRKHRSHLDPFDCYTGNGENYIGLRENSASGRKCKNWLDAGESPTTSGIGNHQYCRNPGGSKDKPWCFTVDPNKEWEECVIPECKDADEAPKAWVAPEGSKSEDAPKPCEYTPTEAPMDTFEDGRACEANKGSVVWLIGRKLLEASDAEDCRKQCRMESGTKFFTHYGSADDDGNNCGCYRQCVLVPEDQTVNSPVTYKMN